MSHDLGLRDLIDVHRRGLWVEEHGEQFAVPQEVLDAEGLVDMSWHNDVSPKFEARIHDELCVALWVTHPDPDQREACQSRFMVDVEPWNSEDSAILELAGIPSTMNGEHPFWEGDDPLVAVAQVVLLLNRVRPLVKP